MSVREVSAVEVDERGAPKKFRHNSYKGKPMDEIGAALKRVKLIPRYIPFKPASLYIEQIISFIQRCAGGCEVAAVAADGCAI